MLEGGAQPADAVLRKRAGRVLRYVVAGLLIGLLLYRVDWPNASSAFSQISLDLLAGAFAAMAIGLVVSAWKWGWALRLHDLHHPYSFLLRTLCIGFFLNGFLPTAVGGDAYRVMRTLPRDGYRSRALSAVVVERAMGFLALIVLGGIGALYLAPRHPVARDYGYILLAFAAFGIIAFIALGGGWLHRIVHRWRHLPVVNSVRHNLVLLRSQRGAWLGLTAGSLVFQLISVGALFVLFSAVATNATPAQCALIAAALGIAAVLPISVNGVGVMEGAMVTTAVALEIEYEQALIVALARRALTLGLAIPCGVIWLVNARRAALTEDRPNFSGLVQTFRRDGFRAALGALQPPSSHRSTTAPTEVVMPESNTSAGR